MKTLLTASLALLLTAAPALADGRGPIDRGGDTAVAAVLNGQLDLDHVDIDADVDVTRTKGSTAVEVTDQIDNLMGTVTVMSTQVISQINTAPVRARAHVHNVSGNRAADVTAAAVANSVSIMNGVSQ